VTEGVGIDIVDAMTKQDRNFILIPAGTTIGQDYAESFGIHEDGQTGIDIVINKGNSEIKDQTRKLGMATITGLPHTTRSGEEVRIVLQVDGNGVVKGKATHVASQRTVDIQVSYNSFG
jgi:molecular chaperone DnaK (HSP70)